MTGSDSSARSILFAGPDAPDESDLYKCVHCGFCLQVCLGLKPSRREAELR